MLGRRLIKLNRFRVFWTPDLLRRDGTLVFVGGAYEPIEDDGFVGAGAYYLAVGRILFLWLTGVKRPSNVLEIRRKRKGPA